MGIGMRVAWVVLWCLGSLGWALDQDRDGYPDAAELHSTTARQAFLGWFAAVAEALYTAPPADWLPQDRDCSGLLRYAFVEALKPKTAAWLAKFDYFPPVKLPPVPLTYPLPQISRSVFRVAPGAYMPGDVEEGRLVGRTTAYYLMKYATVPLGRTRERAQPGDLLFFVHPLARGSAYHSMVLLEGNRVVYHTGLSPQDGGEIRLLTLETLNKHPQESWHPVPQNPNFLGYFRWKIAN